MSELAPTTTVRARRHPLLVGVLFVVHLVIAAGVVWPGVWLLRATYGSQPAGDRVLFADGAYDLIDFVFQVLPTSTAAIAGHLLVFVPIAFALHVFTFGAALATLAFELPKPRRARARAAISLSLAAVQRLGVLSLLLLLGQALVLMFAGLVFSAVSGALGLRLGPIASDRIALISAAPFVLAAIALFVVRDVAAVGVVVDDARTFKGLGAAFSLVFKRPILMAEYAMRGLVGLGALAFGAFVATRLGGRPGAALFGIFAIHQAVVALRLSLRVSWLAAAIRRRASAPIRA